MSALEEIITHTKHIQSLLEDSKASSHRDQVIEAINELLTEREKLIPILASPITEKEQRLMKEFLHMNEETEAKMNAFLEMIKQDMQTSKLQRRSNQSYMNPYNDVQVADGMFIDKKN